VPIGKPFIAMKRALTIGVTVNPAFKIRNLLRDTISAIGTSELSYNPARIWRKASRRRRWNRRRARKCWPPAA
jgi:hypothetical protein